MSHISDTLINVNQRHIPNSVSNKHFILIKKKKQETLPFELNDWIFNFKFSLLVLLPWYDSQHLQFIHNCVCCLKYWFCLPFKFKIGEDRKMNVLFNDVTCTANWKHVFEGVGVNSSLSKYHEPCFSFSNVLLRQTKIILPLLNFTDYVLSENYVWFGAWKS